MVILLGGTTLPHMVLFAVWHYAPAHGYFGSVALRSRTWVIFAVWHFAPAHGYFCCVALRSRTWLYWQCGTTLPHMVVYFCCVALRSRTWLFFVVWHYVPAHGYMFVVWHYAPTHVFIFSVALRSRTCIYCSPRGYQQLHMGFS